MTRKQAISQAIEILSDNPDYSEITSKLEEVRDALPLAKWTKESLLDCIEDYAINNNNILPQMKELVNDNNMPSRTAIEDFFNVTSVIEFYKKYFPNYEIRPINSSPYRYESEDYFSKTFVENYESIKNRLKVRKVLEKVYNRNRENGTPLASVIAKRENCKTYEELLIKYGYSKPKLPLSTTVSVTYDKEKNPNIDLLNTLKDMGY